ncbi:MAG: GNAT family N-acetyltransferase [Clostridia bacterium]|nr:GNAT family N-acetyltransferase [Clostridia bacterium]MBQ1554018.1 GNAT family N-acetyltransferase [Clostridia bacterium]
MNAEIDISKTELKTRRLTLRPWRESDLDDFYEYASVDGVGEMAGWCHHTSKEESKEILDMFIKEKKTFAIDYNGKAIGSLGIEWYKEEDMPELADQKGREIGFVLSKDYWGQGLMPEAVRAVIAYLFDELGLDFIICCHYTDNPRSGRVQEKCGFRFYKSNRSMTRYGVEKDGCVNILFRKNDKHIG